MPTLLHSDLVRRITEKKKLTFISGELPSIFSGVPVLRCLGDFSAHLRSSSQFKILTGIVLLGRFGIDFEERRSRAPEKWKNFSCQIEKSVNTERSPMKRDSSGLGLQK
jgi:hypothetical protein